jgi:hypothetical protein
MTLHLLGIRSDSRCPVDATCVWQGTVEAEIRVGWDGLLADTVIDLVRSNPIRFGTAHILHLVSVAPGPGPAGGPPQTDPYRLAFRIDHEPVQ